MQGTRCWQSGTPVRIGAIPKVNAALATGEWDAHARANKGGPGAMRGFQAAAFVGNRSAGGGDHVSSGAEPES